jgi:hypothetical protein
MDRAKRLALMAGMLTALTVSSTSAQPAVNLSGTYRCVQGCASGFEGRPAFVTQNGWDINLVTEAGASVRAWFDWFSPNTRIWIEAAHQGAVFANDGTTLQFDRGGVWQRDLGPEPAAIAYCARRFRSYDANSQTYLGRGGERRSCPMVAAR